MKKNYTREELIALCERAIVQQEDWLNRDTPEAQSQIGKAWAYLKAGCNFEIETQGVCATDEHTIWVKIYRLTFQDFELGRETPTNEFLAYIPTDLRLKNSGGGDWY